MNIGKAAKLSGLTVKAVRYYSDIGIIKPNVAVDTGYRDFSEPDLAKLQFVAKARKFDFSLDDCRELLALYENTERSSKEVKALTLEKIAEIETNRLVKISENLLPSLFPKKPEIIAANSGRKTIKISILPFQIIYFFNSNRA